MKYIFFTGPVFFLLGSILVTGQGQGPSLDENQFGNNPFTSIQLQKGALDSLVLFQEQVVLHLDKDFVQPKDQLFFRANILTGPKRVLASKSDVLKVELLDASGKLVHNQYHRIEDGTSIGSFSVPKRLKSGEYYFRAYTRWMLNYGPENLATQKIWVGNQKEFGTKFKRYSDKLAVFPEGGNFISGVSNRLVFELPFEKASHFSIVDSQNTLVGTLKNYGKGVGSVLLTPKSGEKYRLQAEDGSLLELPEVEDLGYSLQLNNLEKDKAKIRIEASQELKEEKVFLHGYFRGVEYFKAVVEFDKEAMAEVEIPKSGLPNGIIELTLKDDFDQVWARRPLLVEKEELSITVQENSASNGQKELTFFVKDANGTPVKTQLSIGVGKSGFRYNALHSKNELTLRNQRFLDDLLVLTGQFSENHVGSALSEFPTEIKYSFQEGLEFYGQAYDLDDNLLSNTKIQMLISNDKSVLVDEVVTNSNGLFSLSGLKFEGEVNIVFRTAGEETKSKLVRVIPYEYEIPKMIINGLVAENKKREKKSRQFVPRRPVVEFNEEGSSSDLVALDEVTLVEKKIEKAVTPSVYGIEPSRVIYQDVERPKTIPQLFLTIPGVQVSNIGDIARVSVRLPRAAGVGPVLWVLDGLPLLQPQSLPEIMSMVPNIDIERIEILYGPQAAIYGTRAAGGAILIYTRSGSNEDYFNRKKGQIAYQGFHESIDFDTYLSSKGNKKNTNENALTHYWNPDISTDENGKATILLTPLETNELLHINVKAIDKDGKFGSLNKEIQF